MLAGDNSNAAKRITAKRKHLKIELPVHLGRHTYICMYVCIYVHSTATLLLWKADGWTDNKIIPSNKNKMYDIHRQTRIQRGDKCDSYTNKDKTA